MAVEAWLDVFFPKASCQTVIAWFDRYTLLSESEHIGCVSA